MPTPVFAFLAFTSGSYEGAIIRDMRLANALHRRGFPVHIYWMMETNDTLVDKDIPRRMLVRAPRYTFRTPSGLLDRLGSLTHLYPQARRRRFMQEHPAVTIGFLCNFVRSMTGGANDPPLVARLEKFLIEDGVTHVLPTFAMLCPLALAVRDRGRHAFDFLPTFQGEEIFANFAKSEGFLEEYYAQLRRIVAASRWPCVAVSDDYIRRLSEEMGIDAGKLKTIYPGIEIPPSGATPSFNPIAEKFPGIDAKIPILTYFGRQDSEKGIDLLLYAARMLRDRGVQFQLVICGGSSFGWSYQEMCQQIANHLRLPIFWKRRISDDLRSALYAHSRCIVYPSIHREPFGMVAAETMSYGTPIIVPDAGGVTEAIRANGQVGGLTFKIWDSGDLANQMEKIVTDDALHVELASHTRAIAEHFTVDVMTDRVLDHLGLPMRAS